MPASGFALGVDFGTSNTVAVARTPDGRARTLVVDGSPIVPSAVYAEPGAALLVGRDAILSSRIEPARFEPNPKRRIDDGSILLGDRDVPVVDLVGAMLKRIDEEWTRTVGAVRPELTLTHPAGWGAPRRNVLLAAAESAGFDQVRLMAEPIAAAIYFVHVLGHELPVGSVLVVHDVGAGTFDVGAVTRTRTGLEILAVDGRDDLGGLEVDAAVVAHLDRSHRDRHPDAWQRLTAPGSAEDRRARQLLWDDVRAAKERLSRANAVDLLIPLAGASVHLTRTELESLATPALAESVRTTAALVDALDVAQRRIAGVFLVGGTSRIPLLATLLFQQLGRPPVIIEQPELVVAEGSVQAYSPAPSTTFAMPSTPISPAPPVPVPVRRRRLLRRLATVAAVPMAAMSVAATVVIVATLIVLGIVTYSIVTGQGFLPDWPFLPTAPWR